MLKEIFDLVRQKISEKDKKLIAKAYRFAQKNHEGSKRASGEPSFSHSLETAKILAKFGLDAKTIAAGLLHDILEDTKISEKELTQKFSKEITFLVKGATKLSKLRYRGVERHAESLRKLFIAMAEDIRVLIIKLADRLHNVQTLKYLPERKQKRIALETIEIHARLANRLGIGQLRGNLEDYAFPYAYPKEYKIVEELLNQKGHIGQKYLDKIKKSLIKELIKNGIKNIKTDYRLKYKYSLYCKLLKNDMNIDKIYDIVALRIIVPTIEDCYKVLGIIHSMWRPLPGQIKDYIANPKINGYKSLHTTIFTGDGGIAEIQIRTEEMHQEAEYGIAAHSLYKEPSLKKKYSQIALNKASWLNRLKELQKGITEPEKFMENLKIDFFRDRIFIFTPKGDVIDLPEGSTLIDFAYAIHSEIGDHAVKAKINGKFAPLFTKLKNEDLVEIVIDEKSNPSRKWLGNIKTALAKKHIRSYLQKNSFLNRLKMFGKSESK